MLRRMCNCVKENPELYAQKILTGKIERRVVINDRVITILKCTRCQHRWHYARKIK